MKGTYRFVDALRPLRYHHSGSHMILRQRRDRAVNKPPAEDDKKPHWGTGTLEANTYSVWQGQGFNYLFSLLPKVHVRWVSHWGLSITSSIPVRGPPGGWGVRAGNSRSLSIFFFLPFLRNRMQFFFLNEIDD